MIYARKNRRNINFITKRRAKIWKFDFFVVSLHRIWKWNWLKENHESTMDEFGG